MSKIVDGLILALTGVAALTGFVFMVAHGLRLLVGAARGRPVRVQARKRWLAIICFASTLAVLGALATRQQATTAPLLWGLIAMIAGLRWKHWDKVLRLGSGGLARPGGGSDPRHPAE